MIPGIVDTLAAAHGAGPALDATQVAPYLTGQGSVPVWDLTNAIEKGDTPTALAVLHRMLTVSSPMQPKPMHPLQLLGMLHSQYRKLLALDDPEVRSAEDAARGARGSHEPERGPVSSAPGTCARDGRAPPRLRPPGPRRIST